MNVGFDAKRAFLNFTGLGNYSRFIIQALQQHYSDSKYFLFTPKNYLNTETKSLDQSNTEVIAPTRFLKGSLWRTYGIRSEPAVGKLNIFHGLSGELPIGLPGSVRKVVTVHDLIFLRFPELYNPVDRLIYKLKVKSACTNADKVIAVSEQTARDVVEYLEIDPEKIKVVYQGCHPNFRIQRSQADIDTAKRKYNLPNDYILYVGTIEKRKNLGLLIEALALLPADMKIKLVAVGKKTSYFNEVEKLVHSKKVQNLVNFYHNIDFADLPLIYRGAKIFVYPSHFEGFGIPIVEAIESNVPVITSTGSCFNEAGGLDSIYIDPNKSDELAFQLERLLRDTELTRVITEKSNNFVKKFHPEPIARDMMTIYNSLL